MTLRHVHATIVAVEKQYVSSMQCTCTILSLVSCPTLHYFSTYHKWHDFQKKSYWT